RSMAQNRNQRPGPARTLAEVSALRNACNGEPDGRCRGDENACFANLRTRLAEALDCDELVAFGSSVGDGNGTRNLVPVDLVQGGSPDILARLTIGGRHCQPAACSRGEAAIHAIAVGVVGNNENALFGLSGGAESQSRKA